MSGFSFTPGDKHVLIEVAATEPTTALFTNLSQEYASNHSGSNVVLSLDKVEALAADAVESIEAFFKQVRAEEHSFIVAQLDEELGHLLPNIEQTPTATEAQDLVFMEEVERELGAHLDFDEEEN